MDQNIDAVFLAAAEYLENGDAVPPEEYMRDARSRSKFSAAIMKQIHAEARIANQKTCENSKRIDHLTLAVLALFVLLAWLGGPNLVALIT